MREGWKEEKLGSLNITFIDGDRSSKYPKRSEFKKEGVVFLNANSISNGQFEKSNVNYISKEKFSTIKKGRISLEDIVMTTRGNGVGDCYYHNIDFGDGLINAQMLILRCSKTELEPQFLYYQFISDRFKKLVENYSSGSAQPQLPIGSLKAISVLVPPLPTQRKIATILSAYDDLIENNLKRIKLLEEKAQLTYEEWFVRLKFPGHETAVIDEETGLPEGWEEVSLSDVAVINAKSLKKGFDGEIEYIDIASVSPGRIESTTCYTYSDAPGRAKRIVRHGDIIWSCVRPNRKSYAVIWNPKQNLIASTGFCVITPKKLPTSYLLQFVTTDDYVGYLINRAGGAAYPAVKASDFKESTIIVPSEKLIQAFDEIFSNALEVSWNLQNQNQLLKEARDILLPRLMMGLVDVEKIKLETLETAH